MPYCVLPLQTIPPTTCRRTKYHLYAATLSIALQLIIAWFVVFHFCLGWLRLEVFFMIWLFFYISEECREVANHLLVGW
jgi:hypothetical protein